MFLWICHIWTTTVVARLAEHKHEGNAWTGILANQSLLKVSLAWQQQCYRVGMIVKEYENHLRYIRSMVIDLSRCTRINGSHSVACLMHIDRLNWAVFISRTEATTLIGNSTSKRSFKERSISDKDRGKQGQKHFFSSITSTLSDLHEVAGANLLPSSCKLIPWLLTRSELPKERDTRQETRHQRLRCCWMISCRFCCSTRDVLSFSHCCGSFLDLGGPIQSTIQYVVTVEPFNREHWCWINNIDRCESSGSKRFWKMGPRLQVYLPRTCDGLWGISKSQCAYLL